MSALLLCVLALSVATNLPMWALPKWFAEVNSNLVGYYLGLKIIGVAAALGWRAALGRRRAAILSVLLSVCIFLDLKLLSRFLLPVGAQAAAGAPTVMIISADLEGSQQQLPGIAQAVAGGEAPTVIGLSGVTSEIAAELSKKLPQFSVVAQEPRADGFGVALLVRNAAVERLAMAVGQPFEELPPVVGVRLHLQGFPPVELRLLRLPAPLSPRARQVADLITRRVFVPLRNQRSTFVVLGNFNLTPTSKIYRRAVWATQARNAMEGFGYQRSCCFPSPWLRFPVNHLLYGGVLDVGSFEVLPADGGRIAPVRGIFAAHAAALGASSRSAEGTEAP